MHVHAAPEIDGRPLVEVAAERPPVICSYCREAIVHDGEMWLHVRTGLSAHFGAQALALRTNVLAFRGGN